jgi:hypothetical protein
LSIGHFDRLRGFEGIGEAHVGNKDKRFIS